MSYRPHPTRVVRRSRLTQSPHRPAPAAKRSQPAPYPGRPLPRSQASGFPHPTERPRQSPRTAWLAGGSMAFLAAIAVLPAQLRPEASHTVSTAVCQTVVQSEARLSRDQLSKFLALPQQASKTAVQEVIQGPYCQLPGTPEASNREAYPLAFDPDTWFVVQYAGDVYTGYEFTFRP
ncbi:MAG: hypothetical protein AAFY78_09675 [Cyanobacteria bacterium J06648_16]